MAAAGLAVLLGWARRAALGLPGLIALAVLVGGAMALAGVVWAVLLCGTVHVYRQVAALGWDAQVLTVDREGVVLHQFGVGLRWPEIAEVRIVGRPVRGPERWAVGVDVAHVLVFVPTEEASTRLPTVRLPWSMRQILGAYGCPLVVLRKHRGLPQMWCRPGQLLAGNPRQLASEAPAWSTRHYIPSSQ